METYCDSRFRTGTLGTTYSRITWPRISDHSRRTTLAPYCSINRYYDYATDSFVSVDPDLQSTVQAYVFTNDNPLNATDPLGLRGLACSMGTTMETSRSGQRECVRGDSVSSSQTLKTIEKAFTVKNVSAGLDLTGIEIKVAASTLMSDMSKNGGKTLSTKAADALDGIAGLGEGLSRSAGLAGVALTVSSDLANHDSPAYTIGDAISQFSAGAGTAGLAALACSETGPGAFVCGAFGFVAGLIGASSAGILYHYTFGAQ